MKIIKVSEIAQQTLNTWNTFKFYPSTYSNKRILIHKIIK